MKRELWRIWTSRTSNSSHLVIYIERTSFESVFQGNVKIRHIDGYEHYVPSSELRQLTDSELKSCITSILNFMGDNV